MEPKALILLSGGMDSTTLLHYVKYKLNYNNVECLLIDYNQQHKKELIYASDICEEMGIDFCIKEIDIDLKSSLTGNGDIPDASENKQTSTVVPGRNAILISIAVAHAIETDATEVFFAPNMDDFKSYPDCRSEFVSNMNMAMRTAYGVGVYAPLINMSKDDIVKMGVKFGIDYSATWTCYRGEREPCFKCDACIERINAFKVNGRDYYGKRN